MSNYRNIDIDVLARGFKALSHPNRLKIFLRLVNCCTPGTDCAVDEVQECCIGDLGAALDIAPSTLSHHIKELHQAGLLQMSRRGQRMDCRVDADALTTLRDFFITTS